MITARLYQRLRRPAVFRLHDHLRKVQFWPTDRIRRYQYQKLKKLLRHAFLHVPYYRRVFDACSGTPDDIKDLDDLRKLPVLSKDIIRENFDELSATNMSQEEFLANATGGSTGEPLQFFQDEQYTCWADAARIRGWYDIAGCRPGDLCAVLWGAMHEVSSDFSLKERIRDFCLHGEIALNSFNLSDRRKASFLKWCRRIRPTLLRGYFTAVKEFARYLDENNLSFPQLKGIILCAETVDDDSQAYIEKVFGAKSYNTYGGRELSLIAMECAAKNGLHEVSENNYVEFEPIDLPGYENAGNLIVTNLNNYAMPFIRYRIGDIGIPSQRSWCSCGRGLPLIARVIGRTTEMFDFYDGTRIAGEMFIHLMKDFPLKEYQFVQISDARVVLRMSARDANDDQLKRRIRKTYQPFLPAGVALDFEAVDRFERTATGKFRFVFRQMPC